MVGGIGINYRSRETSAATFLGTPAEGFKTRSYFYAQLVIGTTLARIIIAYIFIKP